MTEPDEVGWRVQIGTGLVVHTPMSDERRELFRREEEREAKAAELEAEQRREAAFERRWELQRQGVEPHSVQDVLARASFGQDRQDAVERRREREAAEELGKPIPAHLKLDKYQMKRDGEEREKAKETTPATQADVSKLAGKVGSLTSAVNLLKRRRSAEQDYHQPRDYVRNSGGYITRGPY